MIRLQRDNWSQNVIQIVKANVDDNELLVEAMAYAEFPVKTLPSLALFHRGVAVACLEGSASRGEIKQFGKQTNKQTNKQTPGSFPA